MPKAKTAVIVYGSHFVGKSYTLKQHFKPLVGLSGNQRIFQIADTTTKKQLIGEIRSQSFEEADHNQQSLIDLLKKLAKRDLLVVATRPASESGSLYHDVESLLISHGFSVSSVEILNKGGPSNPSYYQERAQDIYSKL